MSRVITFSKVFPKGHPKEGQPTYFPEKIWKGFYELNGGDVRDFLWYIEQYDNHFGVDNIKNVHNFQPKWHTIRAGHRWKVGDKFSPRVWAGKPYQSKQIIIAPDTEIKKTWDFDKDLLGNELRLKGHLIPEILLEQISMNDGLSVEDLQSWFTKPFTGQIICWNEQINY